MGNTVVTVALNDVTEDKVDLMHLKMGTSNVAKLKFMVE